MVDLLELSREHFCHPKMGGSHSIKKVLDAVWSEATELWEHPWFRQYHKIGADGAPVDPYLTLVPEVDSDLADTLEEDNAGAGVTDGVGAMRAYQSMLYGKHRDDEAYRDSLAAALYRYCGLDTAAMVMIWSYWLTRG